jgi:6,7-dimethyl-8-ribityllumazine synthase
MRKPLKAGAKTASKKPAKLKAHLLLVEARFYEDLGDMLAAGAIAAIEAAGATFERVTVPGALEVPIAVRLADATGHYDGYVALGCIIRGDTYHFEVVCNESARGIMTLGLADGLAIGNGILTVDTIAQALDRADPKAQNKGGGAAEAALALIRLKRQFAASLVKKSGAKK